MIFNSSDSHCQREILDKKTSVDLEDHKASDLFKYFNILLWIQVRFRKSSILILDDSIRMFLLV